MRLLFDHNLPHRLVRQLDDLFPGSSQTRLLGLATASDVAIWEHARARGFAIVTLDADFADLSVLHGHPPKVIWLRCGNATVQRVAELFRRNHATILAFDQDDLSSCLELWA